MAYRDSPAFQGGTRLHPAYRSVPLQQPDHQQFIRTLEGHLGVGLCKCAVCVFLVVKLCAHRLPACLLCHFGFRS